MDHVEIIRLESDRLAEVIRDTELSTTVPTCPDWTASDLLWHFAMVHGFWAQVLAENPTGDQVGEIEKAEPKRPNSLDQMLTIRAGATQALLTQLSQLDDAVERWTWWPPDQSVGFTRRMQTCEATMHRIDAEITAKLPVTPIAADVASLCVSHAVDVMWGWGPENADYKPQAIVEFRATDTGETWLVEVGRYSGQRRDGSEYSGSRAVRATTGVPQTLVTGEAEQLARWAWSRQGTVEMVGEDASNVALNALISQGIQ